MSKIKTTDRKQDELPLDENANVNDLFNVESITAGLAELESPSPHLIKSLPVEKFLLSSNLQKSIRRGRIEMAQASAIALHQMDADYFWRRLPKIAMEDVCLGNVPLCVDVLRFAFNRSLRQRFNESALASYFAASLAASPAKSRTTCDLILLADADPDACAVKQSFARVPNYKLTDIAIDKNASRVERSIALLMLDKLHLRPSMAREICLTRVATALNMPSPLTYLLLNGKNTVGLSVLTPLVFEKIANVETTVAYKTNDEQIINGLLSCSIDQFTRMGKRAIYILLSRDKEISEFISQHANPRCSAINLLGMMIFQVEGSLLDNRLSSDWLDAVFLESETTEMQFLGLPDKVHIEAFRKLVTSKIPKLNEIRRSVMKEGGF